MQHLNCSDEREQTPRMSTQQARSWLGLPENPSAAEKSGSISVASSADSADVAGGRAHGSESNGAVRRNSDVPAARVNERHIHPSRALWEARVASNSFPATPTASSGGGLGDRGDGQGGWGSIGEDGIPPPDDAFWSPVVPGSSPALATEDSSSSPVSLHPAWLQQQQLLQQDVMLAGGWIDRPASRGEEYRREKRRGRDKMKPRTPSSSLMKSGSHAQLTTASITEDSRQRLLGIPWPADMTGHRRARTSGAEFQDVDLYGLGSGGDLDGWPQDAASSRVDSRLWVSIEGHTEIGKGLSGHTAYKIKVTDRATGEQWTVLRRFRQFEELHRELLHVLSRESDANAYVLPPKEVFGGRHGGVIAKRLKLLKVYLDRLVTCSAAFEHRAMASFLELDPNLRGLCAYGRKHGPDCILKEGLLRVKKWDGPHKPVINILEAGMGLIGWTDSYAIVSPGPVFLVYRSAEDDPEKPLWVLPVRRTVGSQVRVRRVDFWRADLEKEKTRFFLVSWEDSSLLCQVESEKSLESWAHALDEDVDLRPQQTEQERAKVDIELKAKEAWTSREEGIWGGL